MGLFLSNAGNSYYLLYCAARPHNLTLAYLPYLPYNHLVLCGYQEYQNLYKLRKVYFHILNCAMLLNNIDDH